jgi:hypothetical protein
MLVALGRMPSRKETARLADLRLGLQQRLETAWECLEPRDEVDLLLLRDAGRRIAPFAPAAVVPIRFTRGAAIFAGAGLIVFAGLGIVRLLSEWNRAGAGLSEASATISDQAALPGEEPLGRRKAGPGSSAVAVQAADSREAASTSNPDRLPDRGGSVRPEEVVQPARPPEKTQASGVTPSFEAQPVAPSSTGRAGAAGIPHRESEAAGRSAGALPARQSGAAGGSEVMGRGSGKPLSVAQGAPSRRASLSRSDADYLTRFSGEIGAYRAAAEAAVSGERIPPGLRAYVAAYFAAVHR